MSGAKVPRVGQLLRRSFAALLLVLVASGAAGFLGAEQQHRAAQRLTDRVTPTQLANAHLRVVLGDAQRSIRGYLLTGDTSFLSSYDAALADFDPSVARLRSLSESSDQLLLSQQVMRAESWLDVAERQQNAEPRSDLAATYAERGKDLFDRFIESNNAYDTVLAGRAADLRDRMFVMYLVSVLGLGVFTAAGLFVSLVTAIRTTRKITRPLESLVRTLQRLGDGEHDARTDPERGPQEVREVARAVNTMADEAEASRRAQADLFAQEQRLVAELREVDRVKTEFLQTVSHELRTPLTSISGYTELLRDSDVGSVTPQQDRMLETIERNTDRLRNLIEDLLTLSRIEAGAFQTVRQPADVCEIVDSAVRAIRPVARGQVELVVNLPDEPVVMDVDRPQIDRLLMNLLSNAVKFTPGGGTVRVDLYVDGDDVVLAVTDTGIGIPVSEQGGLFNRFFRASNAVEDSIPGTGLGLTIVRTIVMNHDGVLQLSSQLGAGTTFTVRLPRHTVAELSREVLHGSALPA